MFIAISNTTDMRDPQFVVRKFTKEQDARDFVAERNNVLAWPGSGNFHNRLAKAVEVKRFHVRAAEERALSYSYSGRIGNNQKDLIKAARSLYDRASQQALRGVGATPEEDYWLESSYSVSQDDGILGDTVRVERVDGAAIRYQKGDNDGFVTYKSERRATPDLVWSFDVDEMPEFTVENAIKIFEISEEHVAGKDPA